MAESCESSSGYRPTLWPGTIVPVPKLQPLTDVVVVMDDEYSGRIEWPCRHDPGVAPEPVDLSVDFYLQELCDLSWGVGIDARTYLERCADWMRTYGMLLLPHDWDRRAFHTGRYDLDVWYIQNQMNTARTAALAWRIVQTGGVAAGELDRAVEENLDSLRSEPMPVGGRLPQMNPEEVESCRRDAIERFLVRPLNYALKPFSIGIGAYGDRSPCIYTTVFLQIYNHMVEDARIKQCAKGDCGKWFVRQRGRARPDYGQHRTQGVKYCSRECAQAQSQRDLRRRRKNLA